MKVKRYISVYEKIGEGLIEEIEINIDLDILRKILNVCEEDLDVFKTYPINENQFQSFCQVIPNLSVVEFDKFDLFYECFSKS